MTDVYDGNAEVLVDATPLPTMVRISTAFAQRMPTQRIIDTVERIEHGRRSASWPSISPSG